MTSPRGRQVCVVMYDIADDERREDVSLYLSGLGVRVQLSVFEIDLPGPAAIGALIRRIRMLIDDHDDQVRVYPLTPADVAGRVIVGNRTLEERADFWLV